MTTTIRLTRKLPFTKSDALREDAALVAESQKLGQWLAGREIGLVTMNQVLAFARTDHPAAKLERGTVYYQWVWDPVDKVSILECVDRGVIAYPLDEESPAIEIQVEISARY